MKESRKNVRLAGMLPLKTDWLCAWESDVGWKDQFIEMLFPKDSSKMRIEQAFLLKYQNLPLRIYKYRDINEDSKKNLLENTVWLADPESLNDPYDCAHLLDLPKMDLEFFRSPPTGLIEKIPQDKIESGILEVLQNTNNPREVFFDVMLASEPEERRVQIKEAFLSSVSALHEDMARSYVAKMKTSFKLCSFSERLDSTLMWAHYANYHKGFCIEYDVKSLPASDYVSRFMYPVIYSDHLLDLTAHVTRGIDGPNFNNLFPNQIGLRKASDWAYEKEWRLLFSNGIIDKPQAYPVPKPLMVYLGSHIEPKHQKEIVDICKTIDVPVKKMQHSLREYRMYAVSLEEADRKRFGQRA